MKWLSKTWVLVALWLVVAVADAQAGVRPRKGAQPVAPALPADLQEKVSALLDKALRSGDFQARATAVEALRLLDPAKGLAAAKEALNDPQWVVASAAVRALIRAGDLTAYEVPLGKALTNPARDVLADGLPLLDLLPPKDAVALLGRVVDDPAIPTRARLAEAVLQRGGALASGILEDVLRSKKPRPGRTVWLDALAKAVRPEQQPLLVAAARGAAPDTLAALLQAAEGQPADQSVAFLAGLLGPKVDPALQARAARVLVAHGDAQGARLLVPLLAAEAAKDRLAALGALVRTPTAEVLTAARALLDKVATLEPAEGLAVLALFGAAGDESAAKAALALIDGDDLSRRAVGTRYLGQLLKGRAIERLAELLQDGSTDVRAAAAKALGDVAHGDAIPALRAALNDREPAVRLEVVAALGHIKDVAIVNIVEFLVSDPDDETRRMAVQALANVRHAAAVPSLRIAVNDRDESIRLLALRALVELAPATGLDMFQRSLGWLGPDVVGELAAQHGEHFLAFLQAALVSERPEIRLAALAALQHVPGDKRLAQLRHEAVGSRFPDLRREALTLIAKTAGSEAVPDCITALADPDTGVRAAALRAFEAAGATGATAFEAVTKALDDADEGVRVVAAATLLRLRP